MRIRLKSKDGKKLEGHISSYGNTVEVKIKDSVRKFIIEKTPFGETVAKDEAGNKYKITPIFSSKYEIVFELNGQTFQFERILPGAEFEEEDESVAIIKISFSGLIRKLYVKKGQNVKKGEVLADVESMKMINSLKSPIDGVVEEIYVSEGKSLMSGEKIMKIVKSQ
jgi:biotin carboxyl carrier protein